jgi:hypothetical protein
MQGDGYLFDGTTITRVALPSSFLVDVPRVTRELPSGVVE